MRLPRLLPLALAVALAACGPSSAPLARPDRDAPPTSSRFYGGTWAGVYTAYQGDTRAVVVVEPLRGERLRGHFLFYADNAYPETPSGHYEFAGAVDARTGTVSLDGTAWVEQPPDYAFVSLVGRYEPREQAWVGTVVFLGERVGGFRLTRLE